MPDQSALIFKIHVTVIAIERLFRSMPSQMTLQEKASFELFMTHVTSYRTSICLTTRRALVLCQMGLNSEEFAAEGTLERFLGQVHAFMLEEIGGVLEYLTADVAIVGAVYLGVSLELGGRCEHLGALLAVERAEGVD